MRSLLFALCLALPVPALASPPKVVTDIPPVHSLVAQVMKGVAAPVLIVPPGTSPHGFALRPSQARALQGADMVVWTGEDLTPWLARALDTIGASANTLELLEHDATTLLPYRHSAIFTSDAADDHGNHENHDHQSDHDEHGDHDTHADHGDHSDDKESKGHADHHHGGDHDPHAWLDPQNAMSWLNVIATELSEIDPENAEVYAANAETTRGELKRLVGEMEAVLHPVRNRPFLVFHDAFHYFEHRFDIEASGAISGTDAAGPGAARLTRVRDHLRETGVVCVFTEPQLNTSVVEAIIDGTDTSLGVLDPLGVDIEPGPDLYATVMTRLASGMAECLD